MAELSKAIARLMEERDRTQVQTPASSDPLKLTEVLDSVRAELIPAERPLAEAFVRLLFDKAGVDLLATVNLGELSALALAAFRFAVEPTWDEPRVLVYDPDLVPHGWQNPCTVVETLMIDRPFIVDTVRECLRELGFTIQRFLHPLLAIERDARGSVLAIAAPGALGRQCSFVHAEIERVPDPAALRTRLSQRLTDLVHATDDYAAMRGALGRVTDELRKRHFDPPWNDGIDEIIAFLDWLGQKNFVFLGYREYEFAGQGAERTAAVRRGSGLGILRPEERSSFFAAQPLPETLRRRINEPPLLTVSKTNAESPIHRRAHMEYVGVKEIDNAGVVVGERRLLGLFTSKAYAEESAQLPLLRHKLAAILEAEEVLEGSHDYKAIATAFNSIPKIELLAASIAQLRDEIKTILGAEGSQDVKVLHHLDALGRGVFVVAMLPRERFSNDLYRRAENALARTLAATAVLDRHLAMDESDQVRMHFYLGVPPDRIDAVRDEDLRAPLLHLLRTWDDRLQDALREQFPRERARLLCSRYLGTFSTGYKAATDVGVAVRDIRCLEEMLASREPQVDLTNDLSGESARFTAVKLYLGDQELVLSDFLPVLENLGLRVFAEDPLDVGALPQIGRVRIHTFFVQDATGARLNVDAVAPRLRPALLSLYAGRIENDRLNTLILEAGLDWRQVDVLRGYVNHGVQIGSAPSRLALVQAVSDAPRSARLLWDYFAAKFDPLQPAAVQERLTRILPEIEQRFLASLDQVPGVEDDRILRALFGALAATTRTNFFRETTVAVAESARAAAAPGDAALAMKFESLRIPQLPRPRPEYEMYVHGISVEGVHLRTAKVARGGIRLSDRPDDFRTEILDLMKTQLVKNAVIVPAGAKGGFIVKRRSGVPATAGQVVTAYRTFISALIDLTDNVNRGRVMPVPGLLYDESDPYLVVAADKGTAAFSDIANDIATQRQFWLGDAFASGGTHGYDHKKEGITARGAWECVRRHFRELGRDTDRRDTITVIGIGDMSGDVFGNGLVLSRRFCLRAAFNHQHIFLDPDPDPARSFAERERLFHLPRSSWMDYDRNLLSEGGAIVPRNAKKVALSPAARRMFGIEQETLSGEEVVQAILRMQADLLWNGGIGTYVKASDEPHAAVGDGANDRVRVNAADLKVAVVAEGGNLGLTQRARVEYALRGGRINTDAIDNSAGVDLSDHEVNLKIALASAVENGEVSVADRNRILSELAPEVTRRVLTHNRRQARALSLDQIRSQTRLNDFRDLISHLETEGLLARQLEALPDRDTLRSRRSTYSGLTRPELAVLLAHSKLWLQKALLRSPLVDEPFFERQLRGYFPDLVNARFGAGVRSHRLRREIIAVELANALIDHTGAAFVCRVARVTGTDPVVIVRAWAVAVAVSGAADVWVAIDESDPPLPPAAEAHCCFALETAIERATKWIVEMHPADAPAADLIDTLASPTEELVAVLPAALPPSAQASASAAIDALAPEGVPRAIAERIVTIDRMADLFEIAQIADALGISRRGAAETYYRVGEIVDVDWVRHALASLTVGDRWEQRAVEGLQQGLLYARRRLAHDLLSVHADGNESAQALREYAETHTQQLRSARALIDDIKSARHPTLAALMVVVRDLDRLVRAET